MVLGEVVGVMEPGVGVVVEYLELLEMLGVKNVAQEMMDMALIEQSTDKRVVPGRGK